MADTFVTIEEAAELEGKSYEVFKKWIQRDINQQYVTKLIPSETGGKPRKYVAVSSLSENAQKAHREVERIRSLTADTVTKFEVVPEEKMQPWYVNADLDWYIEKYKENYYKAVELANIISDFLNNDEDNRTAHAEAFAQEYLGKGQRTL